MKNMQGKSPLPADGFKFWLKLEGAMWKPYTGNLLRFDTSTYYFDSSYMSDKLNFIERFYGTDPKYFPSPIGFLDSPNIFRYSTLIPKQLTYARLKDFFTEDEMVYPFPVSVKQLYLIRAKSTATLYCITATNIVDSIIGGTAVADRERIDQFFRRAADIINIKYKEIRLENADFNRAKLESVIRSLRVGSNDIVVFAYSGHGFSYDNDTNFTYPQMALWHGDKNSAFIRAQSLNLETVFNAIRQKSARLNIVIGDCCNTSVGITRHVVGLPLSKSVPDVLELLFRRNYMRLLMEARGSYIACATRKGEAAAGIPGNGGIFTYCLVENLEGKVVPEETVNPQAVWKDVFDKTQKDAWNMASRYKCDEPNIPCKQTLAFKSLPSLAGSTGKNAAVKRRK
jgi:hypothetical protein